jgi:hypothetical protein
VTRSDARRSFDLVPWLLLAFVLAVWLTETGGQLWRTSHWRHYIYLADAFNHGQLHLFHHPNDAGDMAVIGDRAYVVFGPLPAIPLMPLVLGFGPRAPDVLVLVLTALFGTYAFYRFMREILGPEQRFVIACATLTFALATAQHYGAPMANVWLHAQISATALQCWALWMAAARRPWLTGLALGLAVLTRSTVCLAAPFALCLIVRERTADGRPASARLVGAGWRMAIPIVAGVLTHALYNLARFGSPFDAGYHYILMGDTFIRLIADYGRFSTHFLSQNMSGWLLRAPVLEDGRLHPDPHGMSLLLTTPFLLFAWWPRRPRWIELVAGATALAIALPALLYYNDGWVQFGQRFALDWIALGLFVATCGARAAPRWLVALLTAVGIGVGAWGTLWYQASYLH